jgi:hypothetical protein
MAQESKPVKQSNTVPDWWYRAMKESQESFTPPAHWIEDGEEENPSDTDPEFAQPECLAPSRLDQHG